MKIYKFYLCKKFIQKNKYPAVNTENYFETFGGKIAYLYGYTNDKNIKNEFIEYRNMDLFKLVESNISKEYYEKFAETYPDNELEYNSFVTSSVFDESITSRSVQLVTTNKEASIIFMDNDSIARNQLYDIFDDIMNYNNNDVFFGSLIDFPNIFKHDIIKALEYLEFTNVMLEYFSPENIEIPFIAFKEDKLMAYIKIFGNTYKYEVL